MARERLFGAREVSSRLALGIGGGYLAAYGAAGLLALALPIHGADAAVVSGMAAFAVYASIFLWAFAARRVGRTWLFLLPFALFGVLLLARPSVFR
jgi:hypothetical protein